MNRTRLDGRSGGVCEEKEERREKRMSGKSVEIERAGGKQGKSH